MFALHIAFKSLRFHLVFAIDPEQKHDERGPVDPLGVRNEPESGDIGEAESSFQGNGEFQLCLPRLTY